MKPMQHDVSNRVMGTWSANRAWRNPPTIEEIRSNRAAAIEVMHRFLVGYIRDLNYDLHTFLFLLTSASPELIHKVSTLSVDRLDCSKFKDEQLDALFKCWFYRHSSEEGRKRFIVFETLIAVAKLYQIIAENRIYENSKPFLVSIDCEEIVHLLKFHSTALADLTNDCTFADVYEGF